MKHALCAGAIGLLGLVTGPVLALSGSGDSAVGSIDTVSPTAGAATVPLSAPVAGSTIPYAGASDVSGIARVELWAREDSASWAFSTLVVTDGLSSGSFSFIPAGSGLYHFDLVVEDAVGNRSAAPSGTSGTGDGSTTFTSDVTDWSAFDQ